MYFYFETSEVALYLFSMLKKTWSVFYFFSPEIYT